MTDAVSLGQLSTVGTVASNSVQYDRADKSAVGVGGNASTNGGATGGTKISNLAQGALSTSSTDAVNGAQLRATNANVQLNASNIDVLTGALGGGASVGTKGSVTGPTYALSSVEAGGSASTSSYANVGDALLALGGSVTNLNQAVQNVNTGAGLKFVQGNSSKGGAVAAGAGSTALGPQANAGGNAAISISAIWRQRVGPPPLHSDRTLWPVAVAPSLLGATQSLR
jgi:autotransporter adhesin